MDDSNHHISWPHPLENKWRKIARGREVKSVPIWLYCDDTSGNVSKKWGKLNSWLFNLVGLAASHVKLPFNTHFLSTSPTAPPLEMLEEIRDVLKCVSSD